jgi:hypothetical protein
MDPVSLVALIAACASLATNCAKTAMALRNLAETYKNAELSILTLVEECATVQVALRQIEMWMHQNKDHMEECQAVVLERLESSVSMGQLTMKALEEDIKKAIPKFGAFRRRASFTFIKSLVQEHQGRIRGQVGALQLLLQVINMYCNEGVVLHGIHLSDYDRPHYEDRTDILTTHELVFREVSDSVMSIAPSRLSSRCSISSESFASIADNGPVHYIPFSFDNDLFTSLPYSRNYRPITPITKFGKYLPRSRSLGGRGLIAVAAESGYPLSSSMGKKWHSQEKSSACSLVRVELH